MNKNNIILFIPPVNWNYYPYRDQELPAYLSSMGYKSIYLNPVEYRGSEDVSRFKKVNNRSKPENIKVINRRSCLRKSFIEFFYENWLNIKAIRKYRPHSVISTDHLMAFGTCIYCKIHGIKFIFDVTDNWELVDTSLAGRFYKYIIKPLLAHFAYAVTCTSSQQYKYFKSKRNKNTFLISNGISPVLHEKLKRIDQDSTQRDEVNFIGSLRSWYDFDVLFEVFQKFPELQLNIYGIGPMYAKLKEKTNRIKNICLHGSIDNDQTPELLRRSLFGIVPLKINNLNQSTCPIKLFDYWGAGKAVITVPVEDIKRVAGQSVLYATTKKEYSDAIRLLLSKPELASKLGKEGMNKINKVHNYHHISNQFLQILHTS